MEQKKILYMGIDLTDEQASGKPVWQGNGRTGNYNDRSFKRAVWHSGGPCIWQIPDIFLWGKLKH
ncbi:MAG: hypothetical protein ACLUD0_10535 [Eubacterium ramulus]